MPLLFLENKKKVKTSTGKSNRETINNVVMQATIWGSLFCTASIAKLGKLIYQNEDLLFRYKGMVNTPTLGMVNDILSIQICCEKAVQINVVINAFIGSKKLRLSESKCKRIHISKEKGNDTNCPVLKVHDKEMSSTDKDKYLGDIVHSSGQINQQ